jgi:16S rRNA (uracil1498-N3)-methyltransferase
MQLFYSTEISGNICRLDKNESRHCVRVLRLSEGSRVRVTDGRGNLYEGIITDANPQDCQITVTDVVHDFESRGYRLHIAISPLKNAERFEWFLEKCVEIGIDEITPLICRNTEKPGIRTDRLNSLIISAMKQSLKTFRPVLHDTSQFCDFMSFAQPGIKMISTCNSEIARSKFDEVYMRGQDALILIGPEGDFSDEEIALAISMGYKPVHLGKSRLRTETAGIAACHSVYFINQ